MKKVISFLLLVQLCIAAFAQGDNVGLLPIGNDNIPAGNKAPPGYPSLVYNSSTIYITNNYTIDYIQVIIRDEAGDTIYNNVVTFVPPSLTLTLSEAVDEEKYSIELLYNGIHLIGYF